MSDEDFDRFNISRPPQRKGLTERQIQELLSSEPVDEAGVPFGPGTIANLLRLGKSVPGVFRRLRGMFSGRPQSTAPSNTLRDVVLSDKPANLSRRGFFTNPVQTAVDIPQALREIGISEKNIRSGDEIGNWPEPGSMLDRMHWDTENWEESYDPDTGTDAGDRMQELINEKITRTGYRPITYEGPGGLIRDFETMMRVYRDQALKEAAEKAGRSLEEQIKIELEEADKPGVVAKAADEIRRRYKR